MDLRNQRRSEDGKQQATLAKSYSNDEHVFEKKNYTTCAQNTKEYFMDFCNKTGMHGFNFLGERQRTVAEKIWWSVIILIAFYFCIGMIVQTAVKWMNSPVVVTFATAQTSIWEIPFPAVTICPHVKAQSVLFNYTDVYIKLNKRIHVTEEEKTGFEHLSLVCGAEEELLNKSRLFVDEGAIDFLREVAPEFSLTVFDVNWEGSKYYTENLTDLFTPILTSEGVCYSFNILNHSDMFTDIVVQHQDLFTANDLRSQWSLDDGYNENAEKDLYPRRSSAGFGRGLHLILLTNSVNLDYACGSSSQGYKIILHNPAEIPRPKQHFFKVPLDEAVVVAVRPSITTTSEDLRSYIPEQRKCFFSSEKNLKYFKVYSQANCLNECLINFTLHSCGCVWFHMARSNSTPICSAVQEECVEDAKILFIEKESNYNKKVLEQVPSSESDPVKGCKCLPSCTSLDFDMELSQSGWEWKEKMKILSQTSGWDSDFNEFFLEGTHLSYLSIFYKDMQFITSERNELYSKIDFWANVGGVLGLFTGFTFISGCEVLYYLTLRLWVNIQKFGLRYWSGSEKLLSRKEKQ